MVARRYSSSSAVQIGTAIALVLTACILNAGSPVPASNVASSGSWVSAAAATSASPFESSTISLALESVKHCYLEETQLVVDVVLRNAAEEINGGQFFLSYDDQRLLLLQVLPGDAPFTLPVFQDTSTPGEIDYAIGAGFGLPGTSEDTRMASLVFEIQAAAGLEPALVAFRDHEPSTRVTNASGANIQPALIELPATTLQGTADDLDGDNVLFDCDACPGTIPGIAVDTYGCPPEILGDFDRDGDVDALDMDTFATCKGLPAVPSPAECLDRDFDLDHDVDQTDFAFIQRCRSGTDVIPEPPCFLD